LSQRHHPQHGGWPAAVPAARAHGIHQLRGARAGGPALGRGRAAGARVVRARALEVAVSLRLFLVLMTAIAVVSDSLLHPFYPQFFASVFGIRDPEYVGNYIAASHLTVLLTLPLWARIAKRVPVLHLLIGTQV